MRVDNLKLDRMTLFQAVWLYEIFRTKNSRSVYIGLLILFVILLIIGNDARPLIALIGIGIFSFQFLGSLSSVNYFFNRIKKINRLNYNLEIKDNFFIMNFVNREELKNNNEIYYFKYPILDIIEVTDCYVFLLCDIGGNAIPCCKRYLCTVLIPKKLLGKDFIKNNYSHQNLSEIFTNYYGLESNKTIPDVDYRKFVKENMIKEQNNFENKS